MNRPLNFVPIIALLLAIGHQTAPSLAQDVVEPKLVPFYVQAGLDRRSGTPIRFDVPANRFDRDVLQAVEVGPVRLGLQYFGLKSQLPKAGQADVLGRSSRTIAQAEKLAGTTDLRVTCLLVEEIPAGDEGLFLLSGVSDDETRWKLTETQPGSLDLKLGERSVFRYNAAPVTSPNYGPIQHRDAYIHPAYSPSGALITGDFSSSHPHHRGFFLAYEKTKTGELTPDFWNIHLGTGKIHSEGFEKPVVGPLTARFSARHRWDAIEKATGKELTVLRERWEVEAYSIPDAPYWLFDVTSTQEAVGRPLELLPYRYGGMAYRGPEPFVKGKLDVLTSAGFNRRNGDQKPARWVDLTGPVAEGSNQYAGAMIADHPSNPNYPNVARIHPTSLPFFCFVPAHDKPLTIAVGTPTVFRYRVMIHDGHPDKDLNERLARDFAEPPVVIVEEVARASR